MYAVQTVMLQWSALNFATKRELIHSPVVMAMTTWERKLATGLHTHHNGYSTSLAFLYGGLEHAETSLCPLLNIWSHFESSMGSETVIAKVKDVDAALQALSLNALSLAISAHKKYHRKLGYLFNLATAS